MKNVHIRQVTFSDMDVHCSDWEVFRFQGFFNMGVNGSKKRDRKKCLDWEVFGLARCSDIQVLLYCTLAQV